MKTEAEIQQRIKEYEEEIEGAIGSVNELVQRLDYNQDSLEIMFSYFAEIIDRNRIKLRELQWILGE